MLRTLYWNEKLLYYPVLKCISRELQFSKDTKARLYLMMGVVSFRSLFNWPVTLVVRGDQVAAAERVWWSPPREKSPCPSLSDSPRPCYRSGWPSAHLKSNHKQSMTFRARQTEINKNIVLIERRYCRFINLSIYFRISDKTWNRRKQTWNILRSLKRWVFRTWYPE